MDDVKKENGRKKGKGMSRRTFIKTTGMMAGAAAIGGFHFIPGRALAAKGPIKLGCPLCSLAFVIASLTAARLCASPLIS